MFLATILLPRAATVCTGKGWQTSSRDNSGALTPSPANITGLVHSRDPKGWYPFQNVCLTLRCESDCTILYARGVSGRADLQCDYGSMGDMQFRISVVVLCTVKEHLLPAIVRGVGAILLRLASWNQGYALLSDVLSPTRVSYVYEDPACIDNNNC